VIQLQAEMRQQETLIVGYQTENERIYEEMKQLRLAGRATEERMFRDNVKLKSELSRIR